jgi:hypothetical protein
LPLVIFSVQANTHLMNINPRIFISKPYLPCPKCRKDGFGVEILGIHSGHYMRRCQDCGHNERFSLPTITKKIIYLDQFVISNMVAALDPDTSSDARKTLDPYWLELYKKLDTLSKYQLIICPDSFYHREESLVSKDFEKRRIIYEHFSDGATFYDKDTITRFQIQKHFGNYLDGKSNEPLGFEAEDMVLGNLHEWQDRIRISIGDRAREGEIEGLRNQREKLYVTFKSVFERWRSEKGKKLDEWVYEEAAGFGRGIWAQFIAFNQRRMTAPDRYLKTGEFDLNDILPPASSEILDGMIREMKARGIDGEIAFEKINEYFNSKYILQVPSIHISSLLFAAIAREAAVGGQIHPPSRGVFVDVNAVSSFLPYVDAMFIDNQMRGYFEKIPPRERAPYVAKVFSVNIKNDFADYLDSILKDADPKHMQTVRELYGDDWGKPYLGILKHRD